MTAPPRTRRLARATVGAVALVLAAVVGATVVLLARSGPGDGQDGTSVRLDRVAEGVSIVDLDGTLVWLDRHGDEIVAFADDANHLPGDALWWCPHDELFAGPAHGEVFDRTGARRGGPSRRGLDRYGTTVEDRTLIVDLDDRTPGSAELVSGPDLTSGGGWDDGPGSFCHEAVRSPMTVEPEPLGGP